MAEAVADGKSGKVVITNIGLLLSGDIDKPILDADTIVVQDGLIVAVGKAKDCDMAHARTVIDVHQTCVAPGLIDSHVHPVFGDWTPRQNQLGWIESTMNGGVTTMSKSKNNGVDPQDIIDRYGADTARLYMMFTAPPEATLEWNDSAVEGSYRYLRRVWNFAVKHQAATVETMQAGCGNAVKYTAAGKVLRFEMYSLYKQANFDYERMQYNTVVSAGMKMLNVLEAAQLSTSYDDRAVLTECTSLLLAVLYPVCPHITTQLWQSLGFASVMGELLNAPWPTVDEAALVKDELELMLQINGKLRGSITVPASADKAAIEAAALASEAFLKAADGAAAKKVIVVPGRLVNVVV